jgi:hypothetical protein
MYAAANAILGNLVKVTPRARSSATWPWPWWERADPGTSRPTPRHTTSRTR